MAYQPPRAPPRFAVARISDQSELRRGITSPSAIFKHRSLFLGKEQKISADLSAFALCSNYRPLCYPPNICSGSERWQRHAQVALPAGTDRAMFQSAERYKASLASGALVASQRVSQIRRRARVLGQDAGARAQEASQRVLLSAGNKAQEASQRALQMVSDIKFEKPDTSCFALVGTALNLLNATTGAPRTERT